MTALRCTPSWHTIEESNITVPLPHVCRRESLLWNSLRQALEGFCIADSLSSGMIGAAALLSHRLRIFSQRKRYLNTCTIIHIVNTPSSNPTVYIPPITIHPSTPIGSLSCALSVAAFSSVSTCFWVETFRFVVACQEKQIPFLGLLLDLSLPWFCRMFHWCLLLSAPEHQFCHWL